MFLILNMRSRKLLQEYDVNRSVILAYPYVGVLVAMGGWDGRAKPTADLYGENSERSRVLSAAGYEAQQEADTAVA